MSVIVIIKVQQGGQARQGKRRKRKEKEGKGQGAKL